MKIVLLPYETRVVGSLIEKSVTTPEQYPLSLNALKNACNQKTNREPVLDFDEVTVQEIVDGLIKKHLVSEKSGFGSRVIKYSQRFAGTTFGEFDFNEQVLGIVCVLFLRGPQTPGELRNRTNRLCHFEDVVEVEQVLKNMLEREDGPFVIMLPREPGRRENRYAHLFSGEVQIPESVQTIKESAGMKSEDRERLADLEAQIKVMRQEIDQLKSLVGED